MAIQVNSIKQSTAAMPQSKARKSGFGKGVSNSVRLILDGKFLNMQDFNSWISFVIFMAILGLAYIGNSHFAEKNIREIEKTNSRIKELKFDYMYRKSQLTEITRQSSVSERLLSVGIKPSVEPPNKIFLKSNTPGHE